MSCADAHDVRRYVEVLAARPLTGPQRSRLMSGLRNHAREAPAEVREGAERARRFLDALDERTGLAQAEQRATEVWAVGHGGAALEGLPAAVDVAGEAIAVWESDDAERLALSEMDVEGFIRYASLAREVQGAEPLKISLADRVGIYRRIRERWRGLDRDGKVALTAFGPFWPAVRDAWWAASYERQQAWARSAPLPPSMVATSAEYVDAITQGDVSAHARTLHAQLGPLKIPQPRH